MNARTVLAGIAVILCAPLAGCSSDDAPVCTSVDDLETSVETLKEVELTTSSTLGEFEDALTGVSDDLKAVKADAEKEFESQLADVEDGFQSVRSSLDAVGEDASAANLTDLKTNVSTTSDSVQTLVDDVKGTC